MKKRILFFNLILVNLFCLNVWSANLPGRQHLLMDYNWKFIQANVKDAEKSEKS